MTPNGLYGGAEAKGEKKQVPPVLATLVDVSSFRTAMHGNRVRRGTEQHSPSMAVLEGQRNGEPVKVKAGGAVLSAILWRACPLIFFALSAKMSVLSW